MFYCAKKTYDCHDSIPKYALMKKVLICPNIFKYNYMDECGLGTEWRGGGKKGENKVGYTGQDGAPSVINS